MFVSIGLAPKEETEFYKDNSFTPTPREERKLKVLRRSRVVKDCGKHGKIARVSNKQIKLSRSLGFGNSRPLWAAIFL